MSKKHRIVRVSGGKVAVTNTSRVPDADVDAAIRLVAKHVNLDRTIVHVKAHGKYRRSWGMAYGHVPGIANTEGLRRWQWSYLITVTDFDLLGTLAHEAKHIEQYRERKPKSELACDAFASWLENQTAPEGAARQQG